MPPVPWRTGVFYAASSTFLPNFACERSWRAACATVEASLPGSAGGTSPFHQRAEVDTEGDEHALVVVAYRQAGADPAPLGRPTTNGPAIGRSLLVMTIPL